MDEVTIILNFDEINWMASNQKQCGHLKLFHADRPQVSDHPIHDECVHGAISPTAIAVRLSLFRWQKSND